MAEIAENLHRREITALERSKLRAKWIEVAGSNKVISAEPRPKSKSDGNPKGAGRKPSGINQAAADLGVPRSTLQQDIKIASLSPEAKEAAVATGLDNNQSALLAAAKHKEPERQVEVIRQRSGGYGRNS